MDLWVLVVGLVMLVVALPVAGRRVFFLFRLITSGQPAPDRVENVTKRLGQAVTSQVTEVFAQRKLLKWSVPGAAHFFVNTGRDIAVSFAVYAPPMDAPDTVPVAPPADVDSAQVPR